MTELDTERARFEAWAIDFGFDVTPNKLSGSTYKDYETHCAWNGYKAALSQQVPDGYAIVPIEPTEAMIEAGLISWSISNPKSPRASITDEYKAMIAAPKDEHD